MHATCPPFAYCTFMNLVPLKREKMNNLRDQVPRKQYIQSLKSKDQTRHVDGGWGAPLVSHISKKKKNKDKFMCSTHYPQHPAFAGFLEIKEFFWLSKKGVFFFFFFFFTLFPLYIFVIYGVSSISKVFTGLHQFVKVYLQNLLWRFSFKKDKGYIAL